MDLIDANARVAIAFGIAMIVLLLTYIAFFKENFKRNVSKRALK